MHNDTIKDCNKLCEKIKEIMIAKYQSSFENIITSKINSSCPKLKIIHKYNVKEYSKPSSIYTDNDVFDIIFKNQILDTDDFELHGHKLLYRKNFTYIAQGEKSDMENLKQIIFEINIK